MPIVANQKQYRTEWMNFKTKKGIERKPVVICAGKDERKRLIAKAKQMAIDNGWKF